MGQSGFDVLLVRKSGPVQSMTFKSWWFVLFFLLIILMIAAIAAGGYFIYLQHGVIKNLSEDTHQMRLRVERLETQVLNEETRQALANGRTPSPAPMAKRAPQKPPEPEKPAPKTTRPPAKSAASDLLQNRPEMIQASASQARPQPKAEPEKPQVDEDDDDAQKADSAEDDEADDILSGEPSKSNRVVINRLSYSRKGKNLTIRFRVSNKRKPKDPAIGYATVVLRGKRAKKVWVEAWPPMRLTPLGRPVNYRRGTPFSVKYYRRVRARFSLDDKKFELMEILVYDRKGRLMLVHKSQLKL